MDILREWTLGNDSYGNRIFLLDNGNEVEIWVDETTTASKVLTIRKEQLKRFLLNLFDYVMKCSELR